MFQIRRIAPALLGVACSGAPAADPSTPAPCASSPTAPASSASASPETTADALAPRPIDVFAEPPAWSAEQLASVEQQVKQKAEAAKVPAQPAAGAPGALIAKRDPARYLASASHFSKHVFGGEPKPGAKGRRAQILHGPLETFPSAQLAADGSVRIRFRTWQPVAAASVYFGARAPSDPFAVSRLRKAVSKELPRGARDHGIDFDPRVLLYRKYDALDVVRTGRGEVRWRLELLDAAEGTSRVYDGSTPFRCEPTPCDENAKYLQLPAFVPAPRVDMPAPDGMTISFGTDAATAGFVAAAKAGAEPRVFESSAAGTHHEIRATGLEPDTRYRYYAFAVDSRGELHRSAGATFRTAPAKGNDEPFSFVALSDSRSGVGTADERYAGTNKRVLEGLLTQALHFAPRFAVFVGDLVDGYVTEPGSLRFELMAWLRAAAPIARHVPIYEGFGNHEALVDYWDVGWAGAQTTPHSAESLFAEAVVNPKNGPKADPGAPPYEENTFSFGYGSVHCAVVNSNYYYRSHPTRDDHPRAGKGQREGWIDDATLAWLDADLKRARVAGARHLLVFTHEPAFPNGGHPHDAMYWKGKEPEVLARRDAFVKVLGKHRVAALITGDEHNYSRLGIDEKVVPGMPSRVWQLVSGGAGAPYYVQEKLPWSSSVSTFDLRQHFIVVTVSGGRLETRVVALSGETIEAFDMTAPER